MHGGALRNHQLYNEGCQVKMHVRPDMQYPNDDREQWQMPLSQSVGDQCSTAGNNVICFKMAQCCCRKMPGGLQTPIWKRQETPHFLCPGEKTQSHRTNEREIIVESYSTKVCNDNQIASQLQTLWVKRFLSLRIIASVHHGKAASSFTMRNEDKHKTMNILLPTGKELQQGGHRFLWLDKRRWPVSWPGLHILLDKKCLLYSRVSKAWVFKTVGLRTAPQWNAWQRKGQHSLSWPLSWDKNCHQGCVTELFVLLHTAVLDMAIHCQLSQVAFQLPKGLLTLSRPCIEQTIQDVLCAGTMLTACSDQDLNLLMSRFCRLQQALQ